MTTQSHTELAAQARKAAKALELLDMDDTAELLRQCAAALESPERVQGGAATVLIGVSLVEVRAKTMYEQHPVYRGTRPIPWNHCPRSVREEWLAKAETATTQPTAPAQDAQGVLIDGVEYFVPMPVAGELLRLHLDLRSTPSPQAERVPLSDGHSPIISAYTITEGINGIKVERAQQLEGPAKWAVRKPGIVLGRSGEWDWEPMPSSRTDEWIAEFRFDSADEAIAAAQAIVTKESST